MYTAWSVVFGEQPTAAKWNQLGENDAGFKDGTNIDAGAIITSLLADDGVTAQKMAYGQAYRRRGGNATDYSTAGTTNYDISATNLLVQFGYHTKSSAGEEDITFPVSFANKPAVWLASVSANGYNGWFRHKASLSDATKIGGVSFFDNTGTPRSGETCSWLAIGAA
jgi:hypothetical protein